MAGSIFISEYEDVVLDKKFHLAHNISVRLYDQLVTLLTDPTIVKKYDYKVNLTSTETERLIKSKNQIQWLYQNNKEKDAQEILVRDIVFANISDICNFLYHSLRSSMDKNTAVAYALIRKPFLENLLIIEQLYTNEKQFINKFNSNPKDYDPLAVSSSEKEQIIKSTFLKLKNINLLNKELIYSLRYDKNNPDSLFAICNKAMHIVTTRHEAFKTETNSFNFIFAEEEDIHLQLEHFYYFLPIICNYILDVIDELLRSKRILPLFIYKKRKFIRMITLVLHMEQFIKVRKTKDSTLNEVFKKVKFKCKKCGYNNQIFKSDFLVLTQTEQIFCKKCLTDIFNKEKSLDLLIRKLIK